MADTGQGYKPCLTNMDRWIGSGTAVRLDLDSLAGIGVMALSHLIWRKFFLTQLPLFGGVVVFVFFQQDAA